MPSTPTRLMDSFGRHIQYLRLSVTDRCDLRCVYCLPKDYRDFHIPEQWLTFVEIQRIVQAFAELGIWRVRITGGEPLVRKNLSTLVAQLAAIPQIHDLSLSTNAVQLAKQATALKQAGITRLNVSLDSLRADRFKQITQGGLLHKVLDGLMTAKQVGFSPIKINMVVMAGVNDDEAEAMVEFCLEHGFTLRFIETMPVGDSGRNASTHYLPLDIIHQRLAQRFELIPSLMSGGGPARYVRVAHTNLDIGFITPISQHFCGSCNRVRLTVDGILQTCLGQEHSLDLRTLLRNKTPSADDLKQAILAAIQLKPERHEFKEKPSQIVRFMSATGG